jgi:hypothetical protein
VISNLLTEDGPLRSETRLRYNSIKCIKFVGNKHILSSYAQHGMKGIKTSIIDLHRCLHYVLQSTKDSCRELDASRLVHFYCLEF